MISGHEWSTKVRGRRSSSAFKTAGSLGGSTRAGSGANVVTAAVELEGGLRANARSERRSSLSASWKLPAAGLNATIDAQGTTDVATLHLRQSGVGDTI